LPRVASREHAAGPAERMAAALRSVAESNAFAGRLALRIGVAAYPDDAPTPELLLEQARAAVREGARGEREISFAPAAPVREPPAHVPWNARYEVGIEVIDGQHRQLLELVNRLSDDLGAGRDFDQLVESLRELVRYTEHHFATEERLMDEVGAGAERHRSEHRRLVDGLMRYTVSLDEGAVSRSSRFLQDWLFRHIDEVDRPFAAFLRSRGVK
jgi:hemerythrin